VNKFAAVANAAREKVLKAIELVEASVTDIGKFSLGRNYTPKELEPYDALSDRFIRAVETAIKFFKSYDYYLNTSASESFRDLLNHMEKQQLITSIDLWVDMRDIRNRIVHDYLPDQQKSIYDEIMGIFFQELLTLKNKIQKIKFE
jgi:nucleotidyltransferase substrate binding protein (TIGR01987 family)